MKITAGIAGDPTYFINETDDSVSLKPIKISRPTQYSVDLRSLTEILHNAIVTSPHTVINEIKSVTLGLTAEKTSQTYSYSFASPYDQKLQIHSAPVSLQEGVNKYHHLLSKSLKKKLAGCKHPYLLQSAGKDSTSIAIALAETNPTTECITYLGGNEENEVQSAKAIASHFGFKHHALVSDTQRAYKRYLEQIPKLGLITGDFAFLSYFDLLGEISQDNGDTVIDGLGSDIYLGAPLGSEQSLAYKLANNLSLPSWVYRLPIIKDSFKMCYALSSLELTKLERLLPGSRFNKQEIDQLLGKKSSYEPNSRMKHFMSSFDSQSLVEQKRVVSLAMLEAGGAFAKGRYSADSFNMNVVYPFCDQELAEFVSQLPEELRMDRKTGTNKILVREHIKTHFSSLPYVQSKGSFRFDLVDFAQTCFDQVMHFAELNNDLIPGAKEWLVLNRPYLKNKYFASKFYLLALVLPWLLKQKN